MYRGEGIEIDVDGSWQEDGRVGYGLVIRKEGKEVYRESGTVPQEDPDLSQHRQIGGEIYAVVQALRWCWKNQVSACTVYYDYEGLAKWASGAWKARTPLTRRYADFMKRVPVQVTWVKLPAHQGHVWNEIADRLAKGTKKPDPPSV